MKMGRRNCKKMHKWKLILKKEKIKDYVSIELKSWKMKQLMLIQNFACFNINY